MITGCSSEPPEVALPKVTLHSVKGSVLRADGKPVSEGMITFTSKKIDVRPASASIQPDGTFTLKTGDAEGAAEGEYIVSISSSKTEPGLKSGSTKLVVPLEYNDDSSTLTATVKPGSNELPPFKLVPGGNKGGKTSNRLD